jgi:hypothetical protein
LRGDHGEVSEPGLRTVISTSPTTCSRRRPPHRPLTFLQPTALIGPNRCCDPARSCQASSAPRRRG